MLNPCYTGYSSNFKTSSDGWTKEIVANGPEKCRDYGRYVGSRYKDYANIIWQAGGDTTIPVGSDLEQNWLEFLRGMKEHAPTHLWTAHWYRFTTALDQTTFAQYMDLDNAYGGNRSYVHTLRAYNRANPKPTFYNEAYYEDTRLGWQAWVRRSRCGRRPTGLSFPGRPGISSAATMSGRTADRWAEAGNPRGLDWRTGMDRQPSQEMIYVKKLFEGRAWHDSFRIRTIPWSLAGTERLGKTTGRPAATM